ncbi:Carboxylesterase type B OS=Tsukamurella paurometabola (strain ATCC 8368 / DSM / CCUG 35730 /CIP 100753 / JCM 10117 / KCTC 9821 / NBRC 16120 / NCIMB 702349/ NCTC 13040) OX=521096 GN=Tpau_2852 PE=4 SV=1 [Tsukamurella paurometabola]|uniref:Carboxylesterase type B n=1 Tax=Tsukamurella paurometabola (strain ATCC 8368 / DSM 20162 / CCUG 35730 / CIP 100753 / JCM 10117 / KCTC 9821 / NBRC 16120 / NCIMB 702349 / NCTC 13040) TaxID=521096 RepID=D5UTG5_TSUPD|nr:carboxylesterase family protein [Tsukamurella paurometabola]ADG79450.1 Carboxylesterase type B [Tsukamurella paurometabola DSM 20162]SUP35798.1 Para-nitrobenzyl esterase [Tsukamurella paurometabola]
MTERIAVTESGTVRGTVAHGIATYRGIPYAASPVGSLRFAPPQPCEPWAGVLDGAHAGPSVPQGPSRLEAVMGRRVPDWDEDGCLTLNVWAPDGAADRPILPWFHGGGFTSGSGGWDWYDGAQLAGAGDIVVVTANYRVGPLGFIHHPDLGADNLGIQDQARALNWVARNAAAFGADPARITVGGQSAGAYSALYLALSPATASRVHAVLAQSGPFGMAPQPEDEAVARADRYVALAGVDDPAALRGLAAAQLLDAYRDLAGVTSIPGTVAPPMYPVLGGFGTERPWEESLDAGALNGKALMIGTVRDEMTAFRAVDPRHARDRNAESAAGDALFGIRSIADRHADAGNLVYAYRFDRATTPDPTGLGATHCADLPFAFNTLDSYAGAAMLGDVSAADRALARRFCGAVAGFVATGRPGAPAWEPYRPGEPGTAAIIDR